MTVVPMPMGLAQEVQGPEDDQREVALEEAVGGEIAAEKVVAEELAVEEVASFCSHWWIQTGVTVRKRPIWDKFDDF